MHTHTHTQTHTQIKQLTLITNALMKTAGTRSLYVFATKQPPRMVAALLANVNCYVYTCSRHDNSGNTFY